MKKFIGILCFLFSIQSFAQVDSLVQRLFLIGDAGQLNGNSHPVLDWLSKNINWNDEKNIALFLGDNIYENGLPDEGDAEYPHSKKVIDYQINLVKGKKGRAFFVPGNHDWKGGKIGGWERAMNQVNYINSIGAANIQAYPFNGCPGPVPVELNEKVVLVMMDSQWFLHINDKPGPESDCESRSVEEFAAELQQIVERHPNQLLVLVMHHPMYTYGVHGGAYGLRQHIFPFSDAIKGFYLPLPVLGTVYALARGLFGSLQDTYHPLYRTMINEIEEVLKNHPNPITVAGHEHSLQLILKDSIYHIVSGSSAKLTRLREGKNSLFSALEYGFSVLEVRKSGKVDVKFYNIQNSDLSVPLFSKELKTITTTTPKSTLDTLLPVIGKVQIQASPELKANGIRNFFWGENYRREWTESITVEMLDLGSERGGLKPVRQQGASQTKQLTLTEKNGKEWILRSIERFPTVVIPTDLRSNLQNKTLSKGVSGAYPFASLSVSYLEAAVGIPVLRSKLVYVPDDPRLERFRSGFKNSLAILEEREPVNVRKTISTEELNLALAKNNSEGVNQRAVLRARLLDNFIMDFDRFQGQYRWALKDSGNQKIYFPIPRDHDQAFFKSEGMIMHFIHQPWFMPQTQGFQPKADNIKTFNKTAINFDRSFLSQLSENDWKEEIDRILFLLTDSVIENALAQQPYEVRNYNAVEIVNILKKRRQFFRSEMLEYYHFLSKQVDIVGTNQEELISVSPKASGSLHVKVSRLNGVKDSIIIWERILDPSVTKEIRIYALEGSDSIIINRGESPILVRVIGGPGNDDFFIQGNGKRVKLYDASFEQNNFSGDTTGVGINNLPDPEVNRYNRNGFKYNYIDPTPSVSYNRDEGLSLGLQVEYFKQGFRKEPYGMRQLLRIEKSFGLRSWHIRYESDFIKAVKDFDILISANIKAPHYVTNFFGLGNNTQFDKSRGIQYYRVHYTMAQASVLFGKRLQSWMRVGIGPSFQHFQTTGKQNFFKLVSDPLENGIKETEIFQTKNFLGAEGRVDINSRNHPIVPTRGALIKMYARQLFGLGNKNHNFLQAGMDMRIFMSFVQNTNIVLGTRIGFGRNFGFFDFQQAHYLGGLENLRGYRKERFAGRGVLFNNTELRLKILDFPTYIFSGALGVLAFHDIGRVWADGEKSSKWHNGYGGGLWVSPIKRFVIVGSLAFSKEEKAYPIVSFGFHF